MRCPENKINNWHSPIKQFRPIMYIERRQSSTSSSSFGRKQWEMKQISCYQTESRDELRKRRRSRGLARSQDGGDSQTLEICQKCMPLGTTLDQLLESNMMEHKAARSVVRSRRRPSTSSLQLSFSRTRIEIMANSRRRRKSLQSVNLEACSVTQEFFRSKKVDVLCELSDMEKPSHDHSDHEMSLQELAGDFLSLLRTAANQETDHQLTPAHSNSNVHFGKHHCSSILLV